MRFGAAGRGMPMEESRYLRGAGPFTPLCASIRRMPTPVAVLGAGSFGTCPAVLAALES